MNHWNQSTRKAIVTLSTLLLFVFGINSNLFAQDAANGEKLFNANCASCHKIDKKMTGPALMGAAERAPDKETLYRWIKNSSEVLKEGEPYYTALWEEYNKTAMTTMAHLSDADIDDILLYVDTWEPPVKTGPEIAENSTAAGTGDSNPLAWLIILAIIFFILLRVLTGVRKSLASLYAEKNGLPAPADRSNIQEVIHWFSTHKVATTFVFLGLILMGASDGWFQLKSIGVYDGYAPEQPIKFSHALHAGQNEINCVYCHHGAEKGKHSNIPSVNVCMNCHKAISEGPEHGETEIAKIYEAAGWDPEKQAYTKPEKPIKWVRIHNLPDFAYFNHSQHVVVGKQKCETCHGEVKEQGYPMVQHAELTMGWCINCHRETNVAMEGNEYYDKVHAELKEKYAEEGREVFTVAEMGGLECAKCHY